MKRILGRWYYKLKNHPHGTLTVSAVAGSALVLCLLLSGAVLEPLRALGFAIAIGYSMVLLTLLVTLQGNARAKLNDVQYAISLENGLRRAGFEPEDFFTDEAAGNPSLQLLNLKILLYCQPKCTLEVGSGQTTKLLSCYQLQRPSAYVLTLEQDEGWVRQLGTRIKHDYRHVPLERMEFTCPKTGLRLATDWYKDQAEFHDRTFNYVLVDGPDHGGIGTSHVDYSRAGILRHMPMLLAPSFVVLFDDAERYGEAMTVNALDAILRAHGIAFVRFARYGVKTQVVFCSPDLSFLRSV